MKPKTDIINLTASQEAQFIVDEVFT